MSAAIHTCPSVTIETKTKNAEAAWDPANAEISARCWPVLAPEVSPKKNATSGNHLDCGLKIPMRAATTTVDVDPICHAIDALVDKLAAPDPSATVERTCP